MQTVQRFYAMDVLLLPSPNFVPALALLTERF